MGNEVDRNALASLMLQWYDMNRKLNELECFIRNDVLELGETVVTGYVRATYYKGRKTYDRKTPALSAPPDIIAKHTTETITVKVDYTAICKDAGIEDIPFTQAEPSVKLGLED